jgi:hypothetical protein
MTISSTVRKAGPYSGNDATVSFPFTFKVFSASDVLAVRADATGTETTLALTTDYTVSLNADQNASPGGTVIPTVVLATGLTLTISSALEYLQPIDLTNNGGFYPAVFNTALDRATILIQQLAEKVGRGLKMGISTGPGVNATLPAPAPNTIIGWNAAANGFQNYAPVDNTLLAVALAAPSGAAFMGTIAPGTGAVAMTTQAKLSQIVNVADYGAVLDGVADCAAAFAKASAALPTLGGEIHFRGTALVASKIPLRTGVRIIGEGIATSTGTGAAFRGASCILRGFTGAEPTVDITGDNAGLDGVDIDNDKKGTGDCVRVWGSRLNVGRLSTRNSGGDGFRIGKTEAVAASTNSNLWHIQHLSTRGNTGNGMRLDSTNTSTSTSYPLGATDVNAGYCGLLDAADNGGDGLQIGNANDNVFASVAAQTNSGCGIHFKTDGTKSGPRCNVILANDAEGNTGNDIQIDAATLPTGASGLYNRVYGNRSVAVSSRIVDNSTGSMVVQWNTNVDSGYYYGKRMALLDAAAGATPGLDLYAGPGLAKVATFGGAEGAGSGGKVVISTKRNGNTPIERLIIDEVGNWRVLNAADGILLGKSVVDSTTPGTTLYANGLGRIDLVNTGTGYAQLLSFYNANGAIGGISATGSTTSYTTSSDYRLKQNVAPIEGAWERMSQYKPVEFEFKADPGKRIRGFLAHEFAGPCEQGVVGEKDAVGEGGQPVYQSIDHSKAVPDLVAALQEAMARIEVLEARVGINR